MKRRNPLFWMGVAYLVFLVIFAIAGPIIRHPYDTFVDQPHLQPSAEYWFGTDEQGRDIFARVAYGARLSIFIGLAVQVLSVIIGLIVGVASIFAPKIIRIPIQRLTDAMFAFPGLLLAIMIVGIFAMGVWPVIIALAIGSWPTMARLVKNQVATLKDREYVVASKAMGASTTYQVIKHILPHLWGVILAVMMVDVAATILAESTLSFLGIGVRPPTPTWGGMISIGDQNKISNLNLLIWPSLFLSLTIFALNFVGDGIRAMIDPKQN